MIWHYVGEGLKTDTFLTQAQPIQEESRADLDWRLTANNAVICIPVSDGAKPGLLKCM